MVRDIGLEMVDPNVLENCGIDRKTILACFWYGIERIVLLYQISDIRLFFENDIRFLNSSKQLFDLFI